MRRLFPLLLLLLAAPLAAQTTVNQGAPRTTSNANAWPIKIVFGGVQVDPRAITDDANRLLGKVTFSSAQPVTQSGAWAISFTAPQHMICDSGCGSPPAVPDSAPFTFGTTSVSPIAAVVDDVATNTVAEDSYGAPRMSTTRELYVTQPDVQTSVGVSNLSWALTVQGTGGGIPVPVTDTAVADVWNGVTHTLGVTCASGCSAGTPGQATMAASSPVVIASDQSPVNANLYIDGIAAQHGSASELLVSTPLKAQISTAFTAYGQYLTQAYTDNPAFGTMTVTISDTWAGQIDFYSTLSQLPVSVVNRDTGVLSASVTTNGTYYFPLAGVQAWYIYAHGTWSGSALVEVRGTSFMSSVALGTPLPPGTNAIGHVTVDSAPTTAVTGPLTDTQLRATAVPVSGTFWQATQPVSGTFYQATQPVSLATAPTTPVTGTFWQATQPVSIATMPSTPVTGPLTDTQLRATAVPVSLATAPTTPVTGTFWQATQPVSLATAPTTPVTGTFWQATQPVSLATAPALVASSAVIGHVIVDTTSTTAVTQATAANLNATVTQLALTKGTQGANGVTTQDLKDAGRNQTNYFHAAPIITTTAEVMQTLTGYKSGAAVTATATPAVVTAGKTYRIQSVEITYWAATVIGGARINLRANLSGVGVVGSPLVKSWQVGMPAIFTAGAANTYVFTYPDGLEFAAGTGIAIGVIGEGAVPTTGTITGYVMVAIQGYEY